jgi:hypothetical protein
MLHRPVAAPAIELATLVRARFRVPRERIAFPISDHKASTSAGFDVVVPPRDIAKVRGRSGARRHGLRSSTLTYVPFSKWHPLKAGIRRGEAYRDADKLTPQTIQSFQAGRSRAPHFPVYCAGFNLELLWAAPSDDRSHKWIPPRLSSLLSSSFCYLAAAGTAADAGTKRR